MLIDCGKASTVTHGNPFQPFYEGGVAPFNTWCYTGCHRPAKSPEDEEPAPASK